MNDQSATASAAADHPSRPSGAAPPLTEQLLGIARISDLEEMASGVAHELNQPLGAIVTFAQAGERMLQRPDAPLDSVREVLQLISKEALAAGAGIRRMRQLFARGAMTKVRCSMTETLAALAPLLTELARQYPRAAGGHMRVELELQPALPRVSIDRLRVQHVVCALTTNALEASVAVADADCVRIVAAGDRYTVEVSVLDAGAGIAPAQQAQIFHPFFTTKPAGTGLGLASSRAIIEAHEGSIGFAAADPRGTRFWFKVPACEQE